jgi:hypothetical protein
MVHISKRLHEYQNLISQNVSAIQDLLILLRTSTVPKICPSHTRLHDEGPEEATIVTWQAHTTVGNFGRIFRELRGPRSWWKAQSEWWPFFACPFASA